MVARKLLAEDWKTDRHRVGPGHQGMGTPRADPLSGPYLGLGQLVLQQSQGLRVPTLAVLEGLQLLLQLSLE